MRLHFRYVMESITPILQILSGAPLTLGLSSHCFYSTITKVIQAVDKMREQA